MDVTAGRPRRRRKRSPSPPFLPSPPPSLRPTSSRPERYRDHQYRGGGCSPSSPPLHGGYRDSLPASSPFRPPPSSSPRQASSRAHRYVDDDYGGVRRIPTYSPYRGGQELPQNSPPLPFKRSRLDDGGWSSSGCQAVPQGPEGHWARDCTSSDWKYSKRGERHQTQRNLQTSPKNLKRQRGYSRSPSPRSVRRRSMSQDRGRRSYSDPKGTLMQQSAQVRITSSRKSNCGNAYEIRPVQRYRWSCQRYTWRNKTANRVQVVSGRRQAPRGDCSYFSVSAVTESQLRIICEFPQELSISYIKKKDKKMKLSDGYKKMGRNQRLMKILKESGIPTRLEYRAYCQGKRPSCKMYKINGCVEYHISRRGDIKRALQNHLRRGPMIAVFAISHNYVNCMQNGSIYKFIKNLHMVDDSKNPIYHSVCVVSFGVEAHVPFLEFRTDELEWPEFGRVELPSVKELYGIDMS